MAHGSVTPEGSGLPDATGFGDLPIFTPDAGILERQALIGFNSRDIRARPFHLLRSQFIKWLQGENTSIVGITSATPNAGKSFLSLNLAIALSRVAGQNVYLIDLDLRRGSIAEELGMAPELGISDFLDGTTDDLASLGWLIKDSRLAVFPTRAISSGSAELLAGDRYAELISTFRKNVGKGIVLCDTPPVFANDDTMIAAKRMDGYILVVDSGKTSRKQVEDTMTLLRPIPCLGAVLNRYQGGLIEKYGYGYGYGSSAYDAYN